MAFHVYTLECNKNALDVVRIEKSVTKLIYTFCCSLPENIMSLTPTSNSLTKKYIHLI